MLAVCSNLALAYYNLGEHARVIQYGSQVQQSERKCLVTAVLAVLL